MIDRVLVFCSEIGRLHGDGAAMSDHEATVKHMVEEMGKRGSSAGGGKWVVECQAGWDRVYELGRRESDSVGSGPRLMKVALEKRLGGDIFMGNPLVDWITPLTS